jgi:hypothetical protein
MFRHVPQGRKLADFGKGLVRMKTCHETLFPSDEKFVAELEELVKSDDEYRKKYGEAISLFMKDETLKDRLKIYVSHLQFLSIHTN